MAVVLVYSPSSQWFAAAEISSASHFVVETVSARRGTVPGASWPTFICLRGYDDEFRLVFDHRVGADGRRRGPRSRFGRTMAAFQAAAQQLNEQRSAPRHRATFYDDAGNEAGGIINATEEDLEDAIWAEYDRACDDR